MEYYITVLLSLVINLDMYGHTTIYFILFFRIHRNKVKTSNILKIPIIFLYFESLGLVNAQCYPRYLPELPYVDCPIRYPPDTCFH